MDRTTFWKNFQLGTELHISGSFIYDALRSFDEIADVYNEDEIFTVLYNLSVGLERLLKIAVILIEHETSIDQDAFESRLITHDHLGLLQRIRQSHKLPLANPHNEFLQLLGIFYKTHRYGRYGLNWQHPEGDEVVALHSYLEKHLGIRFAEQVFHTANVEHDRLAKFLGHIVGKITSTLFDVIEREAGRLGIYTAELRANSKANKIFARKKYDFCDEAFLWKELLVFYMHCGKQSGHIGLLKELEPLAFDAGLENEYLQSFFSYEKKLECMDELEMLYEDMEKAQRKERLEVLKHIGNPNVFFDDCESDEPE